MITLSKGIVKLVIVCIATITAISLVCSMYLAILDKPMGEFVALCSAGLGLLGGILIKPDSTPAG